MSEDDGFRPLADPRYFEDTPPRDGAWSGTDDRTQTSHERPPAPEPSTPGPPGFLRVAGGLLLISVGLEHLMNRILPFGIDLEVTKLVIGLLLLSWWTRTTQTWAYIAGVIVTGVGVGSFISGLLPDPFASLLGGIALSGAFLVLATRPPRMTWAYVPAAIIALSAVVGFAFAITSALFASPASGILLPLSLVTAGIVLVARRSVPARARLPILLCCAVVFVMVGAAQASRQVSPLSALFSEATLLDVPVSRSTILPDLAGRTLVIQSESGDVTVTTGFGPEVQVITNRSIGVLTEPGSETVRLENLGADSAEVTVPRGSKVEVRTRSGEVTVTEFAWAEGSRVDIETESGDVTVAVYGDPSIDVRTQSGEADIDGDDFDEPVSEKRSGSDSGTISITTQSGDVKLVRVAPDEPAALEARAAWEINRPLEPAAPPPAP